MVEHQIILNGKKTGFGDKKYTIGLKSDGGATNLSGKLSLGKSDEEFAN